MARWKRILFFDEEGTSAGEVHVCAKFERHAVLVDFAQLEICDSKRSSRFSTAPHILSATQALLFEFNARVSLALCLNCLVGTLFSNWLGFAL